MPCNSTLHTHTKTNTHMTDVELMGGEEWSSSVTSQMTGLKKSL